MTQAERAPRPVDVDTSDVGAFLRADIAWLEAELKHRDRLTTELLISRSALLPLIGASHPPATATLAEAVAHYGLETPLQQQRMSVWQVWARLERWLEAAPSPQPEIKIARTTEVGDASGV